MISIRLNKSAEKAITGGRPWVFRGEFVESSEQVLAEPGELAELRTPKNALLGIGTFNAAAPIPFRLLSTKNEKIDAAFFHARLQAALKKREAIGVPYYRLVHSEADFLPGLVVDRFGEFLTVQISTAGMEKFCGLILQEIEKLLQISAILLKNDIPVRTQEGLAQEVKLIKGIIPNRIEVIENGCTYLADLLGGQKTGWFYDMRENRALVAKEAAGKTMLDLYCNAGGFGILAAKAGASEVTLVDSSAAALALADETIALHKLSQCKTQRAAALEFCAADKKRYGIVIADPPPFVKNKAHLAAGLKGYEKVARLASARVEEGGLLFIASCSHHASKPLFKQAVLSGLGSRKATLLAATGAGRDHPVHPHLPQSEYLKALLFRLS